MRSFVRSLLWIAAIVGALCFLLYLFVFDTWVVPNDDAQLTASIQPTLAPSDRVLIRRGSRPKQGELARCASPESPGRYVVGRVFGRPGGTVQVSRESVVVDGKGISSAHGCGKVTVMQPVTGEPVELSCGVEENGAWSYGVLRHTEFPSGGNPARIEVGKLYLVSDDRHFHQDSRDFGLVDESTCEHVVFRLWGETFTDASRRFTILW